MKKTDKGNYTILDNDFLEAVAKTRFSSEEGRIFWVIVRLTKGYNRQCAYIARSAFEKRTGINRANVRRSLKELDENNIINIDQACPSSPKYSINSISEWAGKEKKAVSNMTRVKQDTGGVSNKTRGGVETDTSKRVKQDTENVSCLTPIKQINKSINKKDINKGKKSPENTSKNNNLSQVKKYAIEAHLVIPKYCQDSFAELVEANGVDMMKEAIDRWTKYHENKCGRKFSFSQKGTNFFDNFPVFSSDEKLKARLEEERGFAAPTPPAPHLQVGAPETEEPPADTPSEELEREKNNLFYKGHCNNIEKLYTGGLQAFERLEPDRYAQELATIGMPLPIIEKYIECVRRIESLETEVSNT
ncbi:MAG: replication protein [bacterium]|nr:replication protein [bacterium]